MKKECQKKKLSFLPVKSDVDVILISVKNENLKYAVINVFIHNQVTATITD
jgi:hypothetical protein